MLNPWRTRYGPWLRWDVWLCRAATRRRRPDLQHAFDGLQVNQEGRAVRVNFDINEELAEKIVK